MAKEGCLEIKMTLRLYIVFLLSAVYGVGVSISQVGKEKNKSNVGAIPFSSSRIASMLS